MDYYRTKAIVELSAGTVLELNADQADRRVRLLKPLGGNRFQALATVQFKRGELLGLAAAPGKALAPLFERVERKAEPKAKA
jgi:hypothetical protein